MKRRIWIAGLCLLLCLLLPIVAQADFGSFSGDSDYGSSGGSSGGSSWDDDSSGKSFDEMNVFDWVILALALSVFVIIGSAQRKSASAPQGRQLAEAPQLLPPERYSELDPGFSSAAFRERLANLYVQMQGAWQSRNIDAVRPYFTDALFSQMDRQLDALRRLGHTNYVERIAVLEVRLKGYYQSAGADHMVAELRTRIVDYTLEDRTGALVSGDPKKERFMTYEWDLVRPSGRFTSPGSDITHMRCPSCGAPLAINQSAKCAYCGSVVTRKQHDWAIFAIKGIAQQTR